MASNTFTWGVTPQLTNGPRTFLWGTTPQVMTGLSTTALLGHSFSVVVPVVDSGSVGHRFTVLPTPKIIGDISVEREVLAANVQVPYTEPAQIIQPVETSTQTETEPELAEKERIESAIANFKQFITAGEEMQTVLGEKLKQRIVKIDSKLSPEVREAIRRLFGINTDEITYDMFKKCLEWRSMVLEAGRKKYGTGNGSS